MKGLGKKCLLGESPPSSLGPQLDSQKSHETSFRINGNLLIIELIYEDSLFNGYCISPKGGRNWALMADLPFTIFYKDKYHLFHLNLTIYLLFFLLETT